MPSASTRSSFRARGKHATTAGPVLQLRFPANVRSREVLPRRVRLRTVLQQLWASRATVPAEVQVNFVDEATICALHQQYLGEAAPTDIITFDLGLAPDGRRLAELYICTAVAQRHAGRWHTTLAQEIHRLVIHGVLHLLGHKDKRPAQRRAMRRQENALLRQLLV